MGGVDRSHRKRDLDAVLRIWAAAESEQLPLAATVIVSLLK
jgi:hypothetical protein